MKPYLFNERFICISGREFWDGQNIRFSNSLNPREQKYRSIVDVCFVHSGVIYAESNNNVNYAIRRIIARREPEVLIDGVYLDVLLFKWQTENIKLLRNEILKGNSFSSTPLEDEWYVPPVDLLDDRVLLPHPKKVLREMGWRDIQEFGLLLKRWQTKMYVYKMKKDEFAKPGKYPRMIGDLGVLASLVGAFFTNKCKDHRAKHPYHYQDNYSDFVKSADPKRLEETFLKAWFNTDPYYIAVHSDDSLLSVRTPDGVNVYNMDISSCDSSHGPEVYKILSEIYPDHFNVIDLLIDQLRQPIVVHNVDKEYRKEHIVLQPIQPTLYSGSTLTTLINTTAVDIIFTSIVHRKAQTEKDIMDAAKAVGYIVTLEHATSPEKMQFLKHSPILKDGRMIPVKNFGVLTRAWGLTRGDLIVKKGRDYRTEALLYQGDMLNGVYANIDCPFLNHVRIKYPATGKYKKIIDKIWYQDSINTSSSEVFKITDSEFFMRYGANANEIEQLYHDFIDHEWTRVYSPLVNRAMGYDYGLNI